MDNLNKKDSSLYGRDKISIRKRRGIKKTLSEHAKHDWGTSPSIYKPRNKKSVTKTIFFFSLIFFVFSLAFLTFQFFSGNGKVSTKNVDIEILGNTFTAGGEELPLQIQVTNRNSIPLEYSDLIITYPDGSGDMVRERVSIGTIKTNETIVESRDVVLFGQQGSLQEVQATIEYRIKGSNAIFYKPFSHFVTLNSAPIDLAVSANGNVVSGQLSSFTITVRANNSATNQDVGVKVDYPTGFRFEEASIEPVYGDNIWSLGDMGEGDEKEITFSGVLFGEESEERSFRFFVGPYSNFSNSELSSVFSSYIHTTSISKPFIGTEVLIAGIDDEIVARKAGENTPVSIKWSNNLSTRVDDVVLEVKINGDILNKSSIQNTGGFYDSNTNTIRWDKSNYSRFASIQPGSRDTISFNFSSLPLYQSGSLAEDEEITVSVSISGKKPTEGSSLESITNQITKIVQINSDLYIVADSFFRTGPFNNKGVVPPVVGRETEYTVILSVTNSANVVSGAKVKTILPSYVVFKNQVYPANELVTFDSSTRELSWDIGAINRGAGLTTAGKEVAILLGLTPSLSQVGGGPLLTGPISISAKDLFTGKILESTDSAVSIRTSNDPGYTSANGRVIAE